MVPEAARVEDMDSRAIWGAVVLALGTFAGSITALTLHVPSTDVIAVITVITVPVLGALIYNKLGNVEKLTNGTNSDLNKKIDTVLNHFMSNTIPVPSNPEAVKTGDTNGGQSD